MTPQRVSKPWYREPWPWFLIAGPAIVVVAGIITTVLAVRSNDGVVADDYYRQGLGINRTLARDARAQALGIAATVRFNEERSAARVTLATNARPPEALRLSLTHPTRAGEDQAVELRHVGPALYEGRFVPPRPGTYRVTLEDGERSWRLSGRWSGDAPAITLGVVD